MTTPTFRGASMVLVAAMLWGTTGTAQTFAPPQLSPYWVGAFRLAVAALFFWPLMCLTARAPLARVRWRSLPYPLLGLAAVCMCAYNLAFFAGLRSCGVATGTAVALGSGPLWAGLLQAAVTKTWPPRAWWCGVGIAVSGVAAMTLGDHLRFTGSPSGLVLCLLAGLSYACYALINQKLVALTTPSVATTVVFSLAALSAAPGALLLAGAPLWHGADLPIMLWLGIVATGIAYLLFSHALRHVSAATAVVLALAEPATAFVLAVTVVGERPGASAVMGLVALLYGLRLVLKSEPQET